MRFYSLSPSPPPIFPALYIGYIYVMFCCYIINYYPILKASYNKATSSGLRRPYLRVIGIEMASDGPGRVNGIPVTPEEEEELRALAVRPDIYEAVAKSIAPSIYGSMG